MVTADPDGGLGKAIVLDFGFAKERARASARRPGAPPDGGTPNYMAPERIRSGGASPEDDVYALGLTLWEMWTCRVPEPGYKPRAKPMRAQIMFDVPAGLSIDEIKQVFRCLADDPPAAFARASPALLQPGHAHDEPDSGPARAARSRSAARAQRDGAVHAGAQGAPRDVRHQRARVRGRARRPRQARSSRLAAAPTTTSSSPRRRRAASTRTSSGRPARWVIEDLGSTNGTYVDHTYERKKTVNLMHGGEVQLGELRFKLVSFAQRERRSQARARLSREARRPHRPSRPRASR